MHEMAITGEIVDAVVEHAKQNNADKVVKVNLRIGELRDIVDDLMQGAFHFLARGTIAEDAKLNITKVPLRAQCQECHLVFPAKLRQPETLVCPDCRSRNLSVYNGREFLIEDIEVA
jgi:hydrogenase nickel incorporation protein HypA/HybF